MQPGEGDLGGAGQVEPVLLERVDVRALGREEAGAVHRLLADEHRRQHRHVTVRDRAVDGEAVDREREQGGVADQVAEPRAGEARGALHVEAADLGVLRALGRRVAGRGGAPRRPPPSRRRERSGPAGSAPARAAGRARPRPRRAAPRLPAAPPSPGSAPRAAPGSACPSPSAGCAARPPPGRARASARPPRAARRTPPPRPCARARRGSRPGRCGPREDRSRDGV